MNAPLRVLFVEDAETDARLLRRHLEQAGYAVESRRVQTAEGMEAALRTGSWDIVISDYSMPSFDGMSALALLKQSGLDIPFILVSGAAGEDIAVEAMRAGASDYVMKDRWARLVPAVRRELEQAQSRKQRKRTQEDLVEMTSRLKEAQRIGRIGSWRLDLRTNTLVWSDEIFRIFEIDPLRFGASYEAFLEAIHPDDREQVDRAYRTSLETGNPYTIDHRLLFPDGRIKYVRERCESYYEDGQAVCSVGTVQDITDQKLAEEALRKSERDYRLLLDNSPDSILRYDRDGRILLVNRPVRDGYRKLFGLAEGAYLGRTNRELGFPPEQCASWEQDIQTVIETGAALEREYVFATPAGEEVYEWRGVPELDAAGEVQSVLCTNRNVTQRKQAEEKERKLRSQLEQAQKLESIGRLAGGVAHDFNNLLSVIITYADLAVSEIPETDPLRADILEIQKAGLRAAALTRQLLAFSRKQILQPKVLDINQVISGVEKMLRRLLGEDITMSLHLPEGIGSVLADPAQLEQVIVNLSVNARDAMPQGGELIIETGSVDLDEEYAAPRLGVRPGPYVLISVRDTGTGMDAETRARLFEPFFSTKERGKGTGLGLATVYGIVKQSGGAIGVESEIGRGATFKIHLPRVEGSAEDTVSDPSPTMATGRETVLIVEDENPVRMLTERILRKAGYDVLSAASAGDALLLCEKRRMAVDLLLTDVVMPHMGGRELAERLVGRIPGLKVIYMSGYTDDAIVRHGVLAAGTRFLSKPISPAELTRTVRAVLDEQPATARERGNRQAS